jgi:hypothetical protein
MDIELVKYMSATRDLIYAVLALNALITIAVVLHIGVVVKRLFAAGQNGYQPSDTATVGFFNKESAKATEAAVKREANDVKTIVDALDTRHQGQMSEYRYQRKKMNSLLIIQRRIHDFMIFERKPATDLPPIDESERDEEA